VITTLVFAVTVARVGLVALIAERNIVLAGNIRRACEYAEQQEREAGQDDKLDASTEVPAPAVLAVLGMLHLGGVREILESESGG